MLRWIAALSATLLLSGCVTTREYVYTNDPSRAGYRVYDDGSYVVDDNYVPQNGTSQDRRYSDGTYYSSASGSSGDYYYRESDYYSSSYGLSYFDYPAYYSIFHPINSWWHDPYYYPNYYYGVTYFPRNYLSIGFGSSFGYGWPSYSYFSYSPYRNSWVDNYYDWQPWYRSYPGYRSHYPTRYGNARNEAERLASWTNARDHYNQGGGLPRGVSYGDIRRNDPTANYGSARGGQRGADYGSRTSPGMDQGTRGFGGNDVRRTGLDRDGRGRGADYGNASNQQIPSRGFGVPINDVRRVDGAREVNGRNPVGTTGNQQIPSRGFGVPQGENVRGNDVRRGANYGSGQQMQPRGNVEISRQEADIRGYDLPSNSGTRRVGRPATGGQAYQREVQQRDAQQYQMQQPQRVMQQNRYDVDNGGGRGGYSLPSNAPQRGYSQQVRENAAPVQQVQRGYGGGGGGGGQAVPQRGYSAPAPAAAPSYAPAPRESYSAPARSEVPRSNSDGDSRPRDSGGVRRVGSNREVE